MLRAIKEKAPIITLIDVEEDKSEKIRSNFAHISNKLNFCGGFAEKKHPAFKEFA